MVDKVPPHDPEIPANYKPQFTLSPEFKKMWTQLFKGSQNKPDDKEMAKMTDQFINFVWNDCNRVLQWALAQQKERHQQEKEDKES